MLNIVYGRAASGKTTAILNKIKAAANSDKEIVYIVPEQFSFESERAVLTLLGDKMFSRVTVLSFSSLADTMMSLCGGTARNILSDADKIMFMSKTLKSLKDELSVWRRYISSVGFASKIVDMIGEFKISAVFPEDLETVAQSVKGSLAEKIKALALTYRTYDALVGQQFIDPADRLQKLYTDLQVNKYFKNKEVFIDGFKGFTGQQYRIIDLITAQSSSLSIAILCQKEDKNAIFENTKATAQKIISIAKKHRIQVSEEYIPETYYIGEGVKNVERILSGNTENSTPSGEGVSLCVAKTIEDEVKYTARNIRRLVREKGYRYKDFVVIARNPEVYEAAIEREFAANDISCFFDKRVPLTISPVYTLIDSAMNCVGHFSTESILRYLKTGLVLDFTNEEISELENYVYLWDIDGSDWESDWDMDPTGFSKTDTNKEQEIKEKLEQINLLRRKAVTWLMKFADSLKGNVRDMCYATLRLLEGVGCDSNMKKMLEETEAIFSPEDVDALRQSWDGIMNVLDGLVKCFGNDSVTDEQFNEMFATSCSTTTIGRIPQMLDEVTFGAAERIRPSRPKVAFILGANYGIFPAISENNSVLSNNERRILKEAGLEIRDKTVFQTVEENLLVYSCVCCSSEMLYITCSQTVDGGKNGEPSSFFKTLVNSLQGCTFSVEPMDGLCEENYPETKQSAFKALCEYTGNNTLGASSLAQAVLWDESLKEKFSRILSSSSKKDMRLSEENAQKLFGNNISLSATKFDTYHTCRFRYFCRYGLDTNIIQPAKLDTMQRGTIVHFVLEKFCNAHLKDIETVTSQQIKTETDEYIAEYFESIKGSKFLFTARFNFLLRKIKEGIIEVIGRIVEEFGQSKFRPEKCEVSIGNNGTIPTVTFPFSQDGKLSLFGSIDRLDRWGSFVRIVDYKTGSKTFELSDTLYGQNLQMLIYLYCVIRGNNEEYKGKNPAGILYLISKKDLEKKGMAMNGLINENLDVIEAMEKENKGVFVPEYKLKKDGTPYKSNASFISEDAFNTIFDYIETLAKKMGQTLHSGDIAVEPVDGCNSTACKYCFYSAVCGIEDEEHKTAIKLSNSEIIEAMRGGALDET